MTNSGSVYEQTLIFDDAYIDISDQTQITGKEGATETKNQPIPDEFTGDEGDYSLLLM